MRPKIFFFTHVQKKKLHPPYLPSNRSFRCIMKSIRCKVDSLQSTFCTKPFKETQNELQTVNTNELITILVDELGITVTYCLCLKVNREDSAKISATEAQGMKRLNFQHERQFALVCSETTITTLRRIDFIMQRNDCTPLVNTPREIR